MRFKFSCSNDPTVHSECITANTVSALAGWLSVSHRNDLEAAENFLSWNDDF